MWDRLLQWDKDLLVYLNGLGSETYDAFWTLLTKFPPWIPFLLLIVFIFFLKYPKKEATIQLLFVLVLAGFVGLLSNLTKEWVGRLRPCNDPEISSLIRILRKPSDFSFFSGHASLSFSVTILVYLFLRKQWRWAFLLFFWPLLFSYSRIYLGVHFPLDIMSGALIGGLCAWGFYKLYKRIIKPGTW